MVPPLRPYAIILNDDDGLDTETETLSQLEDPVFPQWCVALLQISKTFFEYSRAPDALGNILLNGRCDKSTPRGT